MGVGKAEGFSLTKTLLGMMCLTLASTLYFNFALISGDVPRLTLRGYADVPAIQATRFTDHFKELYQYHAPAVRDVEAIELDKSECGPAPFEKYFGSKGKRSANDEDKTIYELFFSATQRPQNFVEIGAYDGVTESNSRFFETCLGWKGLLIEAQPKVFRKTVANRPYSHRVSLAASCSEEEARNGATVDFSSQAFANGAQSNVASAYSGRNDYVSVPCGSLTPILQDLFDGHVTFFSLDVEGAEPLVAKALDFDNLFIEVLIAEQWNAFCGDECESRDEMRNIMKGHGYHLFSKVVRKSDLYMHPNSPLLAEVLKQHTPDVSA